MAGTTVNRRTVLQTLCALTLGSATAVGTGAAGSEKTPPGRCKREAHGKPASDAEALAKDDDTYVAAVDRIVDGEHVVLILEDDGNPVDQLVVPLSEYPMFEEKGLFLLTLGGDEIVDARPLRGKTKRRRRRNQDRFDCLTANTSEDDD